MNKKIGILHLSDIHATKDNTSKLKRLFSLLVNDLEKTKNEYNYDIQFICITGDLINSGDQSEEQLDLVYNTIIQPLLDYTGLDEKNVFLVAGNHEVKRSSIISYVESGLVSTLTSEEAIESFFNEAHADVTERIDYFREFSTMFADNPKINTPYLQTYIRDCSKVKLGFACVNSSWRSTGVGITEKGKMIVGKRQIVDALESISTADIKICLMHHPIDWLVDSDKIAIEKCLNEFDIVLNGHIHESLTSIYTSFNGKCVFNTCGKFDNTSDIYNGYSIITLNPFNRFCEVIIRQYFDYPRNCYDKAINLSPDGVFSASLNEENSDLVLAYNITHAIDRKFTKYANSYFISNLTSDDTTNGFDEAFIQPILSRYSEYEKETRFEQDSDESKDKKDNISLNELCVVNDNVLLLGRKEIGKTTLLHYMVKYYINNFDVITSVPIIVNCLYANYKGKNAIERECLRFISEYCDDDSSFSIADITKLLLSGKAVVMFDNFETVEGKELTIINDFINVYPNNRYIFAEIESISARSIRDVLIAPDCKYQEYHICSLSKRQIRSYAKQSLSSRFDANNSSLVDKIMLCFKKTTLPKTPFVLSIVLSLCDNGDFSPINEAVVMEQFMESLLEKDSPIESHSKTYDFRAKEDFLLYLVSYMHKNNRFFFEHNEFERVTTDYHEKIGFSILDTKFDTLFFEKGVLIQTENIVTFRYACMVEYYIAKLAKEQPDFLSEIMQNETYLNYSNEILYYTGLNRRDYSIIYTIGERLTAYISEYSYLVKELNEYNISIDISLPEKSFSEKINQSRLSENESDELSDTKDYSEDKLPEEINKQNSQNDMNAFISTLLIFGNCVKNLEFIDKQEKISAFHLYIDGLCVLFAIMINKTEERFNSIIELINNSDIDSEEKRNEMQKIENHANDIIKISIPLYIQNIALENIGTSKLKLVFEDSIDNTNDEFKLFFSLFTYCDLRINGLRNQLSKYVKKDHSKSLLKIIFFKLMYYYRFRYFSSSLDKFLEDSLADINIKLHNDNYFAKGKMIGEIKKDRESYDKA